MLDRFHRFAGRLSTWPVVSILFIAFVVLTLAFTSRSDRLGSNPPVLDARYWYTPAEVKVLFDKLGPVDLSFYALTEVTLDLLFPFVYGGILLILIYRLFEPKPARLLLLVPLVGMIADWLENFSVAGMAWTYTGAEPGFASVSTIFTLAKNVLVRLAMIIVLIGAVRALILRRAGEGERPGSVALG